MAQPNKKLPSILIIQCIPIKGRSTSGRVSSPKRHATCQLESKKQKDYPQKEFLFIHSNHPLRLNLIVGFMGVKVMQDSMEVTSEHMRRGD
jgi:hypothetical protein